MFYCGVGCFRSLHSTTTHANQMCHLSGLGVLADGEKSVYRVSFKFSTTLIDLKWPLLQSVADIQVVKVSQNSTSRVIIVGEVYTVIF